ncbi:hypothetical protein V8D89_001501 [Ganoderma adspersum]
MELSNHDSGCRQRIWDTEQRLREHRAGITRVVAKADARKVVIGWCAVNGDCGGEGHRRGTTSNTPPPVCMLKPGLRSIPNTGVESDCGVGHTYRWRRVVVVGAQSLVNGDRGGEGRRQEVVVVAGREPPCFEGGGGVFRVADVADCFSYRSPPSIEYLVVQAVKWSTVMNCLSPACTPKLGSPTTTWRMHSGRMVGRRRCCGAQFGQCQFSSPVLRANCVPFTMPLGQDHACTSWQDVCIWFCLLWGDVVDAGRWSSLVDWAYQAYPNTPIPGGRRLDVPFRDPHFPKFWEVNCHPKLPTDAIAEKCLVYWQNTNPVIMRALHTYLKTVKCWDVVTMLTHPGRN